ncbi:MAG: galactonate dehydratase [Bryobacter sp.]|nr:galactonate dehydratase [Bryobacter sp.]
MNRRSFFSTSAASCCALQQAGLPGQGTPWQNGQYDSVLTKTRITNMKVFGVPIPGAPPDRPYVFVKLETNQGVHGWGEATLEGKAGAVMAAVNDFREHIVGSDPIQVEHHWQSMWVHSFYRPGTVDGSAISGIDQALWDIRGKLLNLPVYKLLGGPIEPRGVRGYYHINASTREELVKLRETATSQGITCFKTGPGGRTWEWIDSHAKIDAAIKRLQMLREALGPDIDIGVDAHAKMSPTVASVILKEVEPLKLLFFEEPCPPENARAMARIARRTSTPIATGERLVSHYSVRELIELDAVDIIQTDINHVGGISALKKVGAICEPAGMGVAPHACEGPIGGIATLQVDASMPNFLVQEICSNAQAGTKEKIWEEWMGFPAMRMVNGYFPLPEKPGLGFDLEESSITKYPFAGTRPMARLFHDDGSVAEW